MWLSGAVQVPYNCKSHWFLTVFLLNFDERICFTITFHISLSHARPSLILHISESVCFDKCLSAERGCTLASVKIRKPNPSILLVKGFFLHILVKYSM